MMHAAKILLVRNFVKRSASWRLLALLAGLGFVTATCSAQIVEIPSAMVAQAPAGPVVSAAPPSNADTATTPATDSLARARKQVREYFEQFSDLTCKESVTQLVLNTSGRTIYRENSAYDYQFQTDDDNGNWKFTEVRTSRNSAFRDPARSLLVTSGFASLLATLSPNCPPVFAARVTDAGQETRR